MFHRLAIATALALLATACAGSEADPPPEVVDIDWAPRIEATRQLNPLEFELFVFVEVNEEPEGGYLLAGRIDFLTGLADITNSSPVSTNPRNRLIVDGRDAYLITAVDQVVAALPAEAEIVRGGIADFAELGVISMDPAVLTGALGLLEAATETRQAAPTTFEVDLNPVAALAGLNDAERRAVPLDLAGVTDTFGFAEVILAADGTTIERFRVRVSGTSEEGDVLLTVDYRISRVGTDLTFDPPPPGSVVELADYPEIRPAISDLGPGFQ